MMNRRPLLFVTVVVMLLTACARAQVQIPGDQPGEPQLAYNHALMEDGYRLPLGHWLPDTPARAVVLALHGFNDFHQSHAPLASRLADNGVAVYAYDQRGFGDTPQAGIWPGTDRLVSDTRTMIRLLRQRYPERPLYLLGESMGVAVAIIAATTIPIPDLDGLILQAPAVWGREIQPWYQRLGLWLGVRITPGLELDAAWVDAEPTDDPQWRDYWAGHPLVRQESRIDTLAGVSELMDQALSASGWITLPTLILYGGRDEIIPAEAVCHMLYRLPSVQANHLAFAYYPEGWHFLTRDSRSGETRRDIVAWVRDPSAELPSGLALSVNEARQQLCRSDGDGD
jgi:alpha-beta hydrolase superfamily lysophospholipase